MDKKEYIERTAAIKYLQGRKAHFEDDIGKGWDAGLDAAIEAVENLPDADVVEVRHGRWIGLEYDGYADGDPVYDLWECSECGEEVRGEYVPITHPWCHCCGARMDKEAKHDKHPPHQV